MKEASGNGYVPIIAQAIEEMKAAQGDSFSLEQINLAELERRTGISRGKLRRLKKNGFRDSRRSDEVRKHKITKLTGNKQRICPYRFTCQGIPWDPVGNSIIQNQLGSTENQE